MSKDKKQKYYAVEFKTIEGYKTEIFEDLEEATIFFDMVANIDEGKSSMALYEVAKIQIHNETYFVEQDTLKIR